MSSRIIMDFEFMAKEFGMGLATGVNAEDFDSLGMRSSSYYRALFLQIYNEAKVDKKTFNMILLVATAVKNRTRILEGLKQMQDQYGGDQWYQETIKFYTNYTVQYVSEAEKKNFKVFPVVNILNAFPNKALVYFIMINKSKLTAMTDEQKYEMVRNNLWFPQLSVTDTLKNEQKNWEENFWNNTVKKSKNSDSTRYEKGFNQSYWETKASDSYPFLDKTTSKPVMGTLGKEQLVAYIDSWL
jgi:hypothetical protein